MLAPMGGRLDSIDLGVDRVVGRALHCHLTRTNRIFGRKSKRGTEALLLNSNLEFGGR